MIDGREDSTFLDDRMQESIQLTLARSCCSPRFKLIKELIGIYSFRFNWILKRIDRDKDPEINILTNVITSRTRSFKQFQILLDPVAHHVLL